MIVRTVDFPVLFPWRHVHRGVVVLVTESGRHEIGFEGYWPPKSERFVEFDDLVELQAAVMRPEAKAHERH